MPDPADQRSFLIRLTRRGAKVADAAIEAICSKQTTIGAAIAALSDEERRSAQRFLQRLLGAFEEAGADSVEEPTPAAALRRRGDRSIREFEAFQRQAAVRLELHAEKHQRIAIGDLRFARISRMRAKTAG